MFRRHVIGSLLAALWLAACAAQPPAAPPAIGDSGVHHTVTEVADITDPAHPQILFRGSNVIGQCGIRNMMELMVGGAGASMGPNPDLTDLGLLCSGTNSFSTQKVACSWTNQSAIVIGAASVGTCTATNTPWQACTGTGTGNFTVDGKDVILFTEGQNGSSPTTVRANYANWLNAGMPNVTRLIVSATPTLFYNGSTLMGVQFTATADGSTANQQWCEYGVRTTQGLVGASSGCGPFESGGGAGNLTPGWQLNHAVISPCLTKSSGQVFQVTVTITWS